jgi:hypothetical protein
MRWPRMTIRRMMVAVAVWAVVFSIPRGIAWCVLTLDLREQYREYSWSFRKLPKSDPCAPHYEEMRRRWEHAADHPWVPINPNWPREPE